MRTAPAVGAIVQVVIPGTDYTIEPGVSQLELGAPVPKRALMVAIAAWVAAELGLPPPARLPRTALVAPQELLAMFFRNEASRVGQTNQPGAAAAGSFMAPEIVALYDDESRTIVLSDTWTGDTPAELSVVVHEMVHHLQNLERQNFACRGEREKAAYEVQARWLALFGRDLFQDFAIDRLTRLVRTSCGL